MLPCVAVDAPDAVPRCSADSHFSLAQACAEAPWRTDEALTDEDRAAPGSHYLACVWEVVRRDHGRTCSLDAGAFARLGAACPPSPGRVRGTV